MDPGAPIDPAFLSDLYEVGGDELVQDVIATFAASVPPRADALQRAAADGQAPQVAAAAHAIVSAAAMVGLVEVEMLARVLEDRARGGTLPPTHAPARLDRAVQEGVRLLQQVARQLRGGDGPPSGARP